MRRAAVCARRSANPDGPPQPPMIEERTRLIVRSTFWVQRAAEFSQPAALSMAFSARSV